MSRRAFVSFLALLAIPFSHAVEVSVSHPSMDQRQGYPAIIPPGGAIPSLTVQSPTAGTLEAELVRSETNAVVQTAVSKVLAPNTPAAVTFDGPLPAEGVYRIDLRILENQAVVYRDACHFSVIDTTALPANHSKVAHPGPNGRMRYIPDARGNRLPDFSGVGYLGGAELPQVPTVLTLQPAPGDATQRIQDAIDLVSARTPDANGFRGALELAAGLYEIAGTLRIRHSGVVLRGVGPGNRQSFTLNPTQNLSLEQWQASMAGTASTVLVATGTNHRTILTIAGSTGISLQESTSTEILNEYVPVGQRWFHVANPEHYSVGDTIQLERRGNADWISHIKMDQIPPRGDGVPITQWAPFNLPFEYTITAIQGDRITVDSGLVCAVEKRWGGGRIRRYTEGGRIRNSGVENLRAVSFWRINSNGKDNTLHADRFVSFERMRDGWARNVTAEHFTVNTVGMFYTASCTLAITIQDCSALAGASSFYSGTGYDGSGRYWLETNTYVGRYGFLLSGQKGLVRGCYTINNRHAFTFSSRVPGPNVFSNCSGSQSLTYSEPHHRWAVGGLYDNVSDNEFSLMNRLNYGSGHGWAGANFVAWNTKGTLICEQPPTAQNWAIGHRSNRVNGPFHSWNLTNFGLSYGYWESLGTHVAPQSLYTQQIADRQTQSGIFLQDGASVTTAVLPHVTVSLEVIAEIGEELNPDHVSYQWSTLSGPGTPVFSHPQALQTSVVLDLPGTYVVELRATSTQDPLLDERKELTLMLMQPPPEIDTAGGTVELLESGTVNYRIHKFTAPGPHQFEVLSGTGEVEVLVVAGGGGGGGSNLNRWGGAGGGAGGMVETTVNVAPGVFTIQVGDGGIGGVGASGDGGFGENSIFGDLVALGGGRGRGQNISTNGGSGSGGAPMTSDTQSNAAGLGLQPVSPSGGYGHDGGVGTGLAGDDRAGGGGGGAGAPGADATNARGGAGGAGLGSAISGTWTLYAGGGGGAGRTAAGSGGSGGGGSGGLNANGSPGAPNTGGGGGASSLGDPHSGGKGGSGIVIVRVPVPKGTTSTAKTWNGGGGDNSWLTADNWTGGVPANDTTTDTAAFGTSSRYNIYLGTGNRSIHAMTFNSATSYNLNLYDSDLSTPRVLTVGSGITVQAGNHKIKGRPGVTTVAGDLILSPGTTFDVASASTFTLEARLKSSNSSNIYNKTGDGTLVLSDYNAGSSAWFFNTLTVSQGTLKMAVAGAFGGLTNNYIVSSGATLELAAASAYGSTNGNLTLNGTGVGGVGALHASETTTIANGTGSIVLASASGIGVTADQTLTLTQDITGTGALEKSGDGTLILNTTNTYSGTTTVSAGTLLVNGGLDGDSAVTVAPNARLGGNGTAPGTVTVQNVGKLLVGITDWSGSPGTGITDLDIGSLIIEGDLHVDVTSSTAYANFTESNQSFTFLTATGGITGFDADNVVITADSFPGTGTWSVAQNGSALELVYTPQGAPGDYAVWNDRYPDDDLSDKNADNDGDGLSNFMEYAFGLDPTSAASNNPITDLSTLKSAGTFTYTRRAGSGAPNYTIWSSPNMQNWTGPLAAAQHAGTPVNGVEMVTVTLHPAPTSDILFVRVKAEEPQP